MNNFDDSDIKIFGGGSKSGSKSIDVDSAQLFEMQKANGNIARSQMLGAALAERVDGLDICIDEVCDEVTSNHMRILMIFSMVVGIEEGLPDRILVRTALNVFYDTLKKEKPQLYDSMSASGAFTFYYLEYRRGGDKAKRIAKAFTMLCGNDGDEKLIGAGDALFCGYFDHARGLSEEMNFVR